MIPQPAIKQWQEAFTWQKDYQIEQDLIICRSVCTLFNDEYLAEHLAYIFAHERILENEGVFF